MKTIDKLYRGYEPLYPIERFCSAGDALFVDIETTGLKKETTNLYLIGCGYYTDEGFMTKLFFADDSSEEFMILKAFADFVRGYTCLFHFNGLHFDIPYLLYKAEQYAIVDLFEGITQIDVYKLSKPLRYLLFPDSMKQKSIESFLCINREDRYNGGELIEVYKRYELTARSEDLDLLVTHNREDVLGMHLIMPILCYLSFYDAPLSYSGYTINTYKDLNGEDKEEVIFEYETTLDFPVSFSASTESMYVRASAVKKHISIRLPLYTDEMKVYFDDYRNYCYIPDEDRAILKSIAVSLPRNRYVRATKDNCYQKVGGTFLKQPASLFTPVLRYDLKDKRKYFRFPEDFQKEKAEQFGRDLLNVFFKMKRRS